MYSLLSLLARSLLAHLFDAVGFLSDDRKASRWLEDGDSRGIVSETVSMQLRSMIYSSDLL